MRVSTYRRLKKLAVECSTYNAFLVHVTHSISDYGVPMWSKRDYEQFYNQVKIGG